MAGRKRKQLIACLLVLLSTATFPTLSLADDAGLIASIGASHKFNKKLSMGVEMEFRSRNDFRTADRVSLGADASYKLLPWLKASAGYMMLVDNNREQITYQDDGVSYNNWRPSYWGVRHRFNVSLTGSYKIQRVEVSLRERWQYTYRPSKMIDNFDFDEGEWEDHEARARTCCAVVCSSSGTSPSASSTRSPVWNSTPRATWKRRVSSSVWATPSRRSTISSSITATK